MRKIAMYVCLNCGYHQGTPHFIPDEEADKWKPSRCKSCGKDNLKFERFEIL